VIEAINAIQWALYYPAVLNSEEVGLGEGEKSAVSASITAYQKGDLLGALENYPVSHHPSSVGGRLYRAGVLLAVGRVDQAEAEMRRLPQKATGRRALEEMISAVKFQEFARSVDPLSSGEWMAHSYYLQSKGQLESALAAAKQATIISPDFGYAWVRVAELEFSFGRTARALEALERGLELTPSNAQGHALRGFLLSAGNRIDEARKAFNRAIQLDGALGNAWLGRGLTFIRQGDEEVGRRDLQTAAVLEPNRAIFHSYLGKAFSEVGDNKDARRDLDRAKELDPYDPTSWLYAAILDKQENRYNAAVDDLQRSVELNDNRRVYRSQFLLDQDRSIRGTNLAAIYLNDGMIEQSIREAVRAVDDDYSSAPAHLFLANSFDALRDPTRILLRYETAWFNELLLSNLLSPVGGGPLSQFVTQQEYSKMFEHDGLGISSVSEYLSTGQLRETASQFGTFGNISYALDTDYLYDSGLRPNSRISRSESYGQFKIQVGSQDTVFFQTKFEDLENGDIFQRYDPKSVDRSPSALSFDFSETQTPGLLLLGWHHEWSPGNHTLLLLGRLANDQSLSAQNTSQVIVTRDVSPFTKGLATELGIQLEDFKDPFGNPDVFGVLQSLTGLGQIEDVKTSRFDFDYHATFETYTAEIQNIITLGPDNLVFGARYQSGQFDTSDRLLSLETNPFTAPLFDIPAAGQSFSVGLERVNAYFYNTWQVDSRFSLTGGLTYDSLRYPDNFRSPPINDRNRTLERLSPKVGFILQPTAGTVLRGAYSEAISGASFDESIRLEPTQVAGFTQAYRSLAPESLIGSVAGSKYRFWGLSLEQKLRTRTFLGLEFDLLEQDLDRTIGVFDDLDSSFYFPAEVLPSSLAAKDSYRENIFTATVNQLIGDGWSIGARYRYTRSHFHEQIPAFLASNAGTTQNISSDADTSRESGLHELQMFALFNHASGFFARAEANWYKQENIVNGQVISASGVSPGTGPGDDFWQMNLIAGWRFYRNQCELSCGILDLNDTDYRLDPLNPYVELPRSRSVAVRARLSF